MASSEALAPIRTIARPRLAPGLILAGALLIGLYLLLPTLIIVPMALTKSQLIQFPPEWISIHAFTDYFQDQQWVDSTITSLKIAVFATVVACTVATFASIGLRGKSIRGKAIVTGVILSPIVVPLIVLALADYLFFARLGFLTGWVKIGLAHSLLVTPYVFVTVQSSLTGLDPALARSAQSLGARPVSVLRHVYWPALRPGILAGAIFAFAVSFDEIVIALFLQSPDATTLPVRMFTSLRYDLTPKIAAVAALLLGLAVIALAAQGLLALRDKKRRAR